MIVLQTMQDAPHFTPQIGEEYFSKNRPRWVDDCNKERRYRLQAYSHQGGGMFIGYTFVEEFNIYPIPERMRFYVLLRREDWEDYESWLVFMVLYT